MIRITEKIKIENIYSCFEKFFEYKYNFTGEVHNFWECVYVAKGSVCVAADAHIYNLEEGQIIFHKPLELHKFYVNCEDGAILKIFSFSASGEITEKTANTVCTVNDFQENIINSMFEYLNNEFKKNNLVFKNEYDKYIGLLKNPVRAQMISAYICQLILSLSQTRKMSLPSLDYDAEIYGKAVEFMNDNISDFISVKAIADFLNISESTLKRIFKKYSDMGVHRYFLLLKITKATELLSNGKSAFEVSEMLGFSSQAYFSACYKRETGKPPSKI